MTITTTWTGSGSTDYYSGANWTAGAPAGDGPNDALIGGVGVTTAYTVVVTADNGSSVGTYSAGNLVLDDSAMTLSIGTHAFTVAYSTTFTAGTVNIAGGFFNFGINTNTFGTDALLTGYGVLTNDISGSGTIEAKGVSQILDVNLNVGAGGMNFEIAGGDTLEFDMVVDASAKVSFETNSGTMLLYDTQDFAGTIYGLVDVPSAGAAQNEIDLGDLTNVTASFDYTTNQITVSGTSVFPGNTVTDKVIQLDPGATYDAGSTVQTVADGSGGTDIFLMVCFAEGTRILTNRGEVAVEALAEGDMVVTADQGTRPINWIGHRHLDLTA
ncbi:MAG: Hint domain-containing protein, partial [Acetobacteraceae bacterium]|nr:Hint domain-containing protein [Acetobacteraceae bacterium]